MLAVHINSTRIHFEIIEETLFLISLSALVARLQVCLCLCGGRGEIGCETVIANLGKEWRKQTERESLE